MTEFFNQPWWVIVVMLLVTIGAALFIGRVHILWDDGPFQIWLERPVTAILTALTIMAGIFNW